MTRQLRRTSAITAVAVFLSLPLAAQTKIVAPKNKYSPAQDVQLGREAAQEARQQLPMLRNGATEDLIESVGQRLVREIPAEFRHPEFRYTFEVANLSDINAFALPGGPMFLNRGMIEAARTDAEVAGVMAHELSHVILRHGTAQATKGQGFAIGSVLGQIAGAIIGGRAGSVLSQGSQIIPGVIFMKYGREYERQADLLGAQIMARAGYDPRQMANMFRTIQQQGGNRGPEWLSSHPDPGNRITAINREAQMVRVEGSADTDDEFRSARAQLSRMAPAPTTAQVAEARKRGQSPSGSVPTTGYRGRVEPPSSRWRTYDADLLRISVPSNWEQIGGRDGAVTYAPEGGYFRNQNGGSVFTHGVEVGVAEVQGNSLQQQTEQIIRSFTQSNPQLRRQSGYSRTNVAGRQGLTVTLSNVSEATGQTEAINVSTTQLRDGRVLFLVGVAPNEEARTYFDTFSRVRQSLQIEDR